MKHTFQCHSSAPNFSYQCGISGCIQTFRTYSAMASHLQRKHPSDCSGSQLEVFPNDIEDTCSSGIQEDDVPTPWSPTTINNKLQAQKSTALLLLTLKERYRLTQVALDFTLGQMKQTVALVLEDVKAAVKNKLVADEVDADEVDIDQCFNLDLFQGLGTEHLQSRFYLEHFNLTVCCYCCLGYICISAFLPAGTCHY